MGKRLIIPGVDYSQNAIDWISIKNFVSTNFRVGISNSNGWEYTTTNNTRCCILNINLSSIISSNYNCIKLKLKSDFNYVFGVGTSDSGVHYTKNKQQTSFSWTTDSLEVIAPISDTTPVIRVNFRYADNVTIFSEDTKLEDIVEEFILLREE